MRRPAREQWETACDGIEAAVARLRREGPALLAQARRSVRDGYPSSSGAEGSPGRKGRGYGDPVGELVVATNPAREVAAKIGTRLLSALRALEAAVCDLQSLDADVVVLEVPVGAGSCGACGRWVSGSQVDRIRAGYCSECYRAWLRTDAGHGRLDRPMFERRRRAEDSASRVQ